MNGQALSRFVVIGFLIAALCFVVMGYDRNLPIAELDEGLLLSQTIRDRGLSDFEVFTVTGYPPVIMALFDGVQRITEALRHESVLNHAGLVIHIVRILSLAANIITVIAIIRIGRKLGYPLVGLVSALVWAILPSVNEQAVLALTESFQIMFISLAAWMMLKTAESRRMVWALLSTLWGLFAILAKYNTFPVLGFGVGVSLYLLWVDRRKRYWAVTLVAQTLMIAVSAYLLLFVYGASDLLSTGHVETSQFAHNGLLRLFDFQEVIYIFANAAQQISLPHLGLLVVILVSGLVVLFRRSDWQTRVMTGYLLVFAVSFIWLIPTYLVFDVLKLRYTSSASSILVVLVCLSLWHLVVLLANQVKRPGAAATAFVVVCLIWMTPPLITRLEELRESAFQDTGQAVVTWSAQSLEPDATLAVVGLEDSDMYWRNFSNIWGDYHGPNRPLANILLYLQEPQSAWLEAGIDYVHLTGNYPGDYPDLPFDRDTMLLIKSFPNAVDATYWRGDAWYIYRLQRYQTEADAVFGDTIRLRGYDLSTEAVSPGDQIAIRTYWQADQIPTRDYHLFIHLSALGEHDVLAQVDGVPGLSTRMTSTWNDPEEVLVGEAYPLAIPADLPAGTYRLLLGLYDLETGQRLDVDNGQQYIELATITVDDGES